MTLKLYVSRDAIHGHSESAVTFAVAIVYGDFFLTVEGVFLDARYGNTAVPFIDEIFEKVDLVSPSIPGSTGGRACAFNRQVIVDGILGPVPLPGNVGFPCRR